MDGMQEWLRRIQLIFWLTLALANSSLADPSFPLAQYFEIQRDNLNAQLRGLLIGSLDGFNSLKLSNLKVSFALSKGAFSVAETSVGTTIWINNIYGELNGRYDGLCTSARGSLSRRSQNFVNRFALLVSTTLLFPGGNSVNTGEVSISFNRGPLTDPLCNELGTSVEEMQNLFAYFILNPIRSYLGRLQLAAVQQLQAAASRNALRIMPSTPIYLPDSFDDGSKRKAK